MNTLYIYIYIILRLILIKACEALDKTKSILNVILST